MPGWTARARKDPGRVPELASPDSGIDVREKLKKAERYGPSRPISIFPLDNGDGTLDLIYMFQHDEKVVQYRCTIKAEEEVESLTDLYKGALNMERENVDLFGLRVKGVPGGLLLLPDAPKAPLRKGPKQEARSDG